MQMATAQPVPKVLSFFHLDSGLCFGGRHPIGENFAFFFFFFTGPPAASASAVTDDAAAAAWAVDDAAADDFGASPV